MREEPAMPSARFPFPYFGHAYAEDAILEVAIWFEHAPSAKDREVIARELTAVHAFSEEPSLEVTWSGNVVSYGDVLDSVRRYVTPRTEPLASALKKVDLSLYGVTKKTMKPVPFGMHVLVDQVLPTLHARWPIAFAVREQARRDKPTAWHAWSVEQAPKVLERVSAFLKTSPPSFGLRRDGFPWVAPWLSAATMVARALMTKPVLASLDPNQKTALASFCRLAAQHATSEPAWDDDDAVASSVKEAREALEAFAAKLDDAPPPLTSADDVLEQIMREAKQFEFTRIKLTDCPAFEQVKTDDALRFKVAIAATERQLRFLEKLGGNRPGNTAIAFGADDQQQLDVREKVISQLLRRKGTFAEDEAVAMLDVLATTRRPLGWWLPVELIAEKVRETRKAARSSQALDEARKRLHAAPYALEHDEARKAFR